MRAYTDTVRDLHKLIDEEISDAKIRRSAKDDLSAIERDFRQLSEQVTQLRIAAGKDIDEAKVQKIAADAVAPLAITVGWHTWLLRGVIVAAAVQIMGGVIVAVIVHSLLNKGG